MKILITTPELEKIGGVENYYKVLRNYLPEYVDFFIIGKRKKENFFKTIKRILCDYFYFKNKIKNYDLVHFNPCFNTKAVLRESIFISISKTEKKKVLVYFRGWNKKLEKKIKKKFFREIFKKYYFISDGLIVLAKEYKDFLRQIGYNKKIYVETTVVDDIFFNRRIKRNIKKKEIINILFLARIVKEKGIYETLDAISILQKKGINVSLIIAGDGKDIDSVKQYVINKKIVNVKFSGYVKGEEKIETFNLADIYILPTYFEGMPTSVLEAMAFGLPIITRKVGGLNDFFENGKMGFITDSKDPFIFAEYIEKLINNPELYEFISEYNYNYANRYFKASEVAKRLLKIYEEILAQDYKK